MSPTDKTGKEAYHLRVRYTSITRGNLTLIAGLRRFPVAAGLATSLLIAGCVVKQPPETLLPPNVEAPEAWTETGGAEPGLAPQEWLADFGDPRLENLVAEALANNQNLQSAAALLEVARQSAIRAGAGLYPFVGLGASGSTEGGFEGGDTSTTRGLSLGVSWEIDLWGGIRAGKAAAEADYQAALSEYEFARLSLAAQTARSWFLAVEKRLQVDLAEWSIDIFERSLSLTLARFHSGLTSELDVHLARFQLATTEESLRLVTSQYKEAVRGLEVLLGRYPKAEMELADQLSLVPPPIPAGLPADLLERRPDLVAAERQVAAAFYTIQVAQAARLPSISLTGSAGTASSDLRDAIRAPDPFWNLAAGLFAPLFAGGELKALVETATATQQAALHGYVQAVLRAFSEVETALANEVLLREAQIFQEIGVREAEDAYRQSLVQYEFGLIDYANVLSIQDRTVAVQSQLLSLKNARLANRINLYLSLGIDYALTNESTVVASASSEEE